MASRACENPPLTNFMCFGKTKECFYGGVIPANLKTEVYKDRADLQLTLGGLVGESDLRVRATLLEHP